MNLWLLRFHVDGDSTQSLGASIVEAWHYMHALAEAWTLGCNPGGAAAGILIRPPVAARVRAEWRNRILSSQEVTSIEQELFGGTSSCTDSSTSNTWA